VVKFIQIIKLKSLSVIVLSACFIVALFCAYYLMSSDGEKEKKPHTLRVGKHLFEIPRDYVWGYNRGKDGIAVGANMRALYPGFEPETRHNKDEFEKGGWANGRLILFSIDDTKATISTSDIIARYLREARETGSYRQEGDFYMYPVRDKKSELILTTLNGENDIYFYCNKDDSVPAPSCNTRVAFTSDMYIYLVFPKTLLPQWQTLSTDLRQLVDSFHIKQLN